MCQNFKISALLLKTSNHLTNQQDDSLPLKTRQEHPAQQLWQIFYYIYLLKDINKLKGLLLNAGNSFIADAISRVFIFFASYHSPSANFAMQISPLRGAKDPSTGGWVAISPRMLSIRLSSLVPAQISTAKRCKYPCNQSHFSEKSENFKLVFLDLAPCWKSATLMA